MKINLTILVLLIIGQTRAQYQKIDTFYYNENWETTDAINATNKALHKYIDTITGAGVIFRFTIDDTLLKETNYANIPDRIQSGAEKEYYKSGKLKHTKNYIDGKLNGELFTYYETGQLKRHDNYLAGELVSGKCFTNTGADTTHFPYEIMPEFVGGVKNLYEYLGSNINYPRLARDNGVQGTAYTKFIVQANGEIGNVEVLRGIGAGCDEEAIRVISEMPNWTPGYIDGIPASVWYKIPIKFTFYDSGMTRKEKKEEKKRLKEQKK